MWCRNDFYVVSITQAVRETIEIFQQKNESFKNALKDVEEVSVSVASGFYTSAVSGLLSYWVILSVFLF